MCTSSGIQALGHVQPIRTKFEESAGFTCYEDSEGDPNFIKYSDFWWLQMSHVTGDGTQACRPGVARKHKFECTFKFNFNAA